MIEVLQRGLGEVKKCPTILVADDEEQLLKVLKVSFGLEGFEVVTANDGLAALRAFEGSQPDAAVLDIGMPGVDGFGVLQFIRERSNIPVILVTASDEPSYQRRALAAGADGYMTKPFDWAELVDRVRSKLSAPVPRRRQRSVN
ncbi:MAG: response regulator [Dehalococcoidales bacterium]|nr:MAG: response regulator [Dehalococcoidales bacterium]